MSTFTSMEFADDVRLADDPHTSLAESLARVREDRSTGVLGLRLAGGGAAALGFVDGVAQRAACAGLHGVVALERSLAGGVVATAFWPEAGEQALDLLGCPDPELAQHPALSSVDLPAAPAPAVAEWLARSGLLEPASALRLDRPDPLAGLARPAPSSGTGDPLAGLGADLAPDSPSGDVLGADVSDALIDPASPVAPLADGVALFDDVRIEAEVFAGGSHTLSYLGTYLPTACPLLVVEHAPIGLCQRGSDGVAVLPIDDAAFASAGAAWASGVSRLRAVRDPGLGRPRALRVANGTRYALCETPAQGVSVPLSFAEPLPAFEAAAAFLSVLARAHLHGVVGFDLRAAALSSDPACVPGAGYALCEIEGGARVPSSGAGFESLLGAGVLSPAADLYGLGASLFEAICEVVPASVDVRCFPSATDPSQDPLPDLFPDWAPEELRVLVLALLDPLPWRRPSGAVAVLRRLRPFIADLRSTRAAASAVALPSPVSAQVRVAPDRPPEPLRPPAVADPAPLPVDRGLDAGIAHRVDPALAPAVADPAPGAVARLDSGVDRDPLPGALAAEQDWAPGVVDQPPAAPVPVPFRLDPIPLEPDAPGAAAAPHRLDLDPAPRSSGPLPGAEAVSEADLPSFTIREPDDLSGDAHPMLQPDREGSGIFDQPPSDHLIDVARSQLAEVLGPFAAMEVTDLLERRVPAGEFITSLGETLADHDSRVRFVDRLRAEAAAH